MPTPSNTLKNPPDQAFNRRLRLVKIVAVASLVSLIVLGVAWELALAPVKPGGSLLALKVLPLCFAVAGFLKNRMYTYRWVSLLVWLYFTEGAVRAWSDRPPGNALALAEAILCLVLFSACVMHIRVRQKHAQAALTTLNEATAAPSNPSNQLTE